MSDVFTLEKSVKGKSGGMTGLGGSVGGTKGSVGGGVSNGAVAVSNPRHSTAQSNPQPRETKQNTQAKKTLKKNSVEDSPPKKLTPGTGQEINEKEKKFSEEKKSAHSGKNASALANPSKGRRQSQDPDAPAHNVSPFLLYSFRGLIS